MPVLLSLHRRRAGCEGWLHLKRLQGNSTEWPRQAQSSLADSRCQSLIHPRQQLTSCFFQACHYHASLSSSASRSLEELHREPHLVAQCPPVKQAMEVGHEVLRQLKGVTPMTTNRLRAVMHCNPRYDNAISHLVPVAFVSYARQAHLRRGCWKVHPRVYRLVRAGTQIIDVSTPLLRVQTKARHGCCIICVDCGGVTTKRPPRRDRKHGAAGSWPHIKPYDTQLLPRLTARYT